MVKHIRLHKDIQVSKLTRAQPQTKRRVEHYLSVYTWTHIHLQLTSVWLMPLTIPKVIKENLNMNNDQDDDTEKYENPR